MIAAFDALVRKHADEMDEAQDEIIRLAAERNDLLAALIIAEDFMSGFENDEAQEGMAEKLAQIRGAIAYAQGG